MKKAILPNGLTFVISDETAEKIKFIQSCIRKTNNYKLSK